MRKRELHPRRGRTPHLFLRGEGVMERALRWPLPLKSPSEEAGVTLPLPQMLPLARRKLLVPPERAGSIGYSKSVFRRFRSGLRI